MTETRHRNGAIKCKLLSIQKLIFCDSGSVLFSCRKNLGGSIRKNGKLTDHVCFVNRALFFLMELAKNHVLNSSRVII